MNAKLFMSGVVALAASLVAGPAHAWTHACNQTSNPIWIAYADDPHDGSVFDYGTNGCANSRSGEWHHTGWYKVNPGACATVNGGKAYLFYHHFYVEDAQGHVWDGGYQVHNFMCTPQTAFDRCEGNFYSPEDAFCDISQRALRYMEFSPTSTNYTVNFHL
jgi:uncharacterized membrane protein